MNNQKTMNKLVEAKFMSDDGHMVRFYNKNGETGIWTQGHSISYPVDLEAFVSAFEKSGKGELVEMTRQVRERELGNVDQAYEVTKFENGKVVSHTN
jgi:hypothetical protein